MEDLYRKLRLEMGNRLSFLKEKPEETIDSSLKALWNKACGRAMSAEEASKLLLPELSDPQVSLLNQLIGERINGKPLAYITGRQNFMGIELLCDPRALIPRKETELLGRVAMRLCQNLLRVKQKIEVFDLCCGSGNLGLALASGLPDIVVDSSDLSQAAVDLTRENISFLRLTERVSARQSDLFSSFESDDYYGNVDLIVCNPPYISTPKVPKMDSEISANEPAMAFDGGMVGVGVIRRLIRESVRFLREDGWLVFEVGVGQGPSIIQLCERSRLYKKIEPGMDDAGIVRVVAACCAQ